MGGEVPVQDASESLLGAAWWRAIVIGQIKVRDAGIEGAHDHIARVGPVVFSAKVVPKAER